MSWPVLLPKDSLLQGMFPGTATTQINNNNNAFRVAGVRLSSGPAPPRKKQRAGAYVCLQQCECPGVWSPMGRAGGKVVWRGEAIVTEQSSAGTSIHTTPGFAGVSKHQTHQAQPPTLKVQELFSYLFYGCLFKEYFHSTKDALPLQGIPSLNEDWSSFPWLFVFESLELE